MKPNNENFLLSKSQLLFFIPSFKCLLYHGRHKILFNFPLLLSTILSTCLIPLRVYENITLRKGIANTKIRKPPIFIIGCPRSGTTYLHNILSLHKDFGYITTPEAFGFCYAHLISTPGTWLNNKFKDFMTKRPQDNVLTSANYPQEEEFALAAFCPYNMVPSYNDPNKLIECVNNYLLLSDMDEKRITQWKSAYLYIIKKITLLRQGKQLLLKNPPNTARIKWLLELFPEAKFIHIYRNPYDIYPSMINLFKSMWKNFLEMGFKITIPEDTFIENQVLKIYTKLMQAYFEQKVLIPPTNLIEIKYEELMENPSIEIKKIYDMLQLDYKNDEKLIEGYLESQRNYEKNKFTLKKEALDKIYLHWNFVIDKWNYTLPPN